MFTYDIVCCRDGIIKPYLRGDVTEIISILPSNLSQEKYVFTGAVDVSNFVPWKDCHIHLPHCVCGYVLFTVLRHYICLHKLCVVILNGSPSSNWSGSMSTGRERFQEIVSHFQQSWGIQSQHLVSSLCRDMNVFIFLTWYMTQHSLLMGFSPRLTCWSMDQKVHARLNLFHRPWYETWLNAMNTKLINIGTNTSH